MPAGMMIPKVPAKVKAESGAASCCMKPRKLAAQAIPTTAPIKMKRMRITVKSLRAWGAAVAGRPAPADR